MEPCSFDRESGEDAEDWNFSKTFDESFHSWLDAYERKHNLTDSAMVSLISPQYKESKRSSLNRVWRNLSCIKTEESYTKKQYQTQQKLSRGLKRIQEKEDVVPHKGYVPDIVFFPMTFLPNFIVEELVHDTEAFFSMPLKFQSHAVFFIADVSGFTHMTETYGRKELSGADALATDLNQFMSNLASTIMFFGGDILRFAGDAYLCQWEAKRTSDLILMAENAYKCAVHIQTVPWSANQTLRVKIGMALGDTTTMVMGSPSESLLFIIVGPGILSVRQAEEFCSAGEIIISPDVYHCLHPKNLIQHNITFLKKGFVKITGFKPNPLLPTTSTSDGGRLQLFRKCSKQSITLGRAFLVPILRDIKTADQLNYLSEVCKVTIMFILLPKIDVTNPERLQPAYQKILAGVKTFGGVLNKVVLFDKGCSFLAVFGLPGVKHLNDAARAIFCADYICTNIEDLTPLISVGISSGPCFCGIVGHALRQEYTVIGCIVNMASRLMTTYPDEPVVLDADTYHLCRQEVGDECFITIEKRKLKGIENVPTLYAYRKASCSSGEDRICVYHPQEISVIAEKPYIDIQILLVSLQSKEKIDAVRLKKLVPVICVEGERGCGKSFFLYYATEIAISLKYQVLTCCALATAVIQPFSTMASLLKQFFSYMSQEMPKREDAVLNFVENTHDPYLFLLNHLLDVHFQMPEDLSIQHEVINHEIQRLLYTIIKKIWRPERGYKMFIGIDSANYIDPYSWRLLKELAEKESIVIMINFLVGFKPPCSAAAQMRMNACHSVCLERFSENLLVPMICWYLNVVGVHKHVKSFLQYHALGDTQLLEELLICPTVADQLRIRKQDEISPTELQQNFFMCGNVILSDAIDDPTLPPPMICDIVTGAQNSWLSTGFKFQDAVKQRLSTLSIQNRVILKRAAIIGYSFYVHTLETANYDVNTQEFQKLIQELVNQNIFCHAIDFKSAVSINRKHPFLIKVVTQCGLVTTKIKPLPGKGISVVPKPNDRLQFSTMAFRACVIEGMTQEQRINMHLDVASHLEKNGLLCIACSYEFLKLRRRSSHTSIRSEERRCLQIPTIDLRQCECLTHKIDTYCLIASLHADIGQLLNPVYFIAKAAEMANLENSCIQSLAFSEYAYQMFPLPSVLKHYNPARSESHVDTNVLKATLLQVKAESLFKLNNMYDGALLIFRAMELLGVSVLGFLHGPLKRQMNFIVRECDTGVRKILATCLSVLAKIYCKREEFKTAFRLAKYQIMLILHCENDFIVGLNAQTLFYKFKCMKYPLQSHSDIHYRLIQDCHEYMMYSPIPVSSLEIEAIAETYIALITHNLNFGKLKTAEKVCAEAHRVLKNVHDIVNMPLVLAFGVQIGLMTYGYATVIMYLKNLRYISIETGSKAFLGVYYAAVLDIKTIFQTQSNFHVIEEYEIYVQMIGDKLPKDVSFFVAAKISYWCLVERNKERDPKMEIFMQWYELAVSLRPKLFENYWYLSGELALLRIQLITNHRLIDQTPEERIEHLVSAEKHLFKLWYVVRTTLPVLEPVWGVVASDMNMAKNNNSVGGRWMQLYNGVIDKLDFLKASRLLFYDT